MLRETVEINMDNIAVSDCIELFEYKRIQKSLLMMVMLLDLRRNKY